MKKLYIQPQIQVFAFRMDYNLLTTSTITVSSEEYDSSNMTDLARESSFWDDVE